MGLRLVTSGGCYLTVGSREDRIDLVTLLNKREEGQSW